MLSANLDAMATQLVQNEINALVESVAAKLADQVRSVASPDELESISQHMTNFKQADSAEPVHRLALAFARVAVFKAVGER
jgi:hypothetical protein